MKTSFKIISLVISLMVIEASAQSDYSVRWEITGILAANIVELEYDLDLGTKYVSAHGTVTRPDGLKRASTGTCFISANQGVFCEMSKAGGGFILDLDESLNGEIRVLGASGDVTETGVANVSEIQ